jgi:hypothetical protein
LKSKNILNRKLDARRNLGNIRKIEEKFRKIRKFEEKFRNLEILKRNKSGFKVYVRNFRIRISIEN